MSHTSILAYLPSPPQGVWYLGPVPLRAYALCIIVGIIVAVWWGDRRWRARGGQPGDVLDVALWAVPFGLIGGRLYHVATDWHRYFGDNGKGLTGVFSIWDGGLGIWGAVALGAVGAWIGCRWKGIKLPPFGDALAPAILLAQAIGRLGNYFNQELYGGPTDLPWGLELFVRRNGAETGIALPDGVSTGVVHSVVHPTFLYELLWNVLVVIALVLIDRRFRIGHGRLFALYVAGYCIGRFGIELLRTDEATQILGVRINVFTSAIVFLCAALYFVLAPRGRELGLSMYWPRRAEELAEEGELGYVPPALDDEYEDDDYEDGEHEDGEHEDGEHEDGNNADDFERDTDDADSQWARGVGVPEPAEPDTEAVVEHDADEADEDEADEDEADADEEAPDEEAPDEEAPDEEAPDEEAPVEDAPGEDAPGEDSSSVYTLTSDPGVGGGGIEIREVISSDVDSSMVILARPEETDAVSDDAAEVAAEEAAEDTDNVSDAAAEDAAEDTDDAGSADGDASDEVHREPSDGKD